MERTTVLILSDGGDGAAGHVAAELAARGVPMAWFDTGEFPQRLRLNVTIEGGGWRGYLTDGQSEVALADVASVYYRGPSWVSGHAGRGLGGVLRALPCLWVNDPVAAAASEHRPVQLAAAERCGLSIPRSLVSNDPAMASTWAKDLATAFVCKPLAGAMHDAAGLTLVEYRQRYETPGILRPPAPTHTAQLLQEWVDKAYEARVIAVGQRVFTVAIHGSADDGPRYEVTELPPLVRMALLELLRRLGLVYGAVDMVVRPDVEWVFLDVDPAGEWAWLAHATGIKVASAFARLLMPCMHVHTRLERAP